MKIIHRYSVPILNTPTTHAFIGKIVHVACKTEDVVDFWVETDPEHNVSSTKRVFEIYPTGVEIPNDAQYIGTALSPSRSYVWNLYERLA